MDNDAKYSDSILSWMSLKIIRSFDAFLIHHLSTSKSGLEKWTHIFCYRMLLPGHGPLKRIHVIDIVAAAVVMIFSVIKQLLMLLREGLIAECY